MGNVFLKLLNMSLAANWLIAAVIILRLIARKTPKWIICLLWGLVAIRLICPFSIESSFGLIPSGDTASTNILSELYHKSNTATGMAMLESAENWYSGDYGNILVPVSGVVWICGVFGLLLYTIIVNFRLRGHLKEAILFRENIYLCDYVRSPFIGGIFCPAIYLPSGIDELDMGYVVAHEKAHLQRKDHIWKMMAFSILITYWFHPLIWISFALFCRDIESACDEKVIKNFCMTEKKAYSRSLLSCSFKKRVAIVYPLTFGGIGVKQRIKSILNYKKPEFTVLLLSFFCLFLTGICFLTNSPQGYQTNAMISTDASPAEIQRHRKQNEKKKKLLDYDRDNITKISVFLQDSGDEVSFSSIMVVGKKKAMDVNELSDIKALASEYLNLDVLNIDLVYIDNETY